MTKWERQFFHKFRGKVKNQKENLHKFTDREDEKGIQAYFEEREKLNELLLHGEVYWKQRVKTFWLKEGDANTKFFHAQATKRKILKNIAYLVTETEEKIDNHEEMCTLTKDYFQGVFSGVSNLIFRHLILNLL